MKSHIAYMILLAASVLLSCNGALDRLEQTNPYDGETKRLHVELSFPDGTAITSKAGIDVTVVSNKNGAIYHVKTDSEGKASIDLQFGFYSLSVSYSHVTNSATGKVLVYNAYADKIRLIETGPDDVYVSLDMSVSYSSTIVFKEIYYSGTSFDGGSPIYQYDKYFILYNNSSDPEYLDGLCFATIEPNNATNNAYWSVMRDGQMVLRDSLPVYDAIWQFPGTGREHLLQPGQQVVVAVNGAIDHTATTPTKEGCPNSVDLSKQGYWVCYSDQYNDPNRHPSPHENMSGHWLNILWKDGRINQYYNFSNNSPASVIFRFPEGVNPSDYVSNTNHIAKRTGATGSMQNASFLMILPDWVLDGVECMKVANFIKRLPATIDASFTLIPNSDLFYGKTVHRKVDEQATLTAGGRVVYLDTNNSANDFEVREKQSLRE